MVQAFSISPNFKPTSQIDIENSELILYEIMILIEAGRFEEALRRLEEDSTAISDRQTYFETRGYPIKCTKII